MRGDLAQSAAAGYHDGKSRASASPPSGRGGEKEGGQTESAAISDDERKSRGGTRVNAARVSNFFIETRAASYSESLDKSRLSVFAYS